MLHDQQFRRKEIIILGASAFRDTLGDLSYTTALYFRELGAIHEVFDFHFCGLDTPNVRADYATLQGWGAPIQLGQFFRNIPNKESHKEFLRLIASIERIHSAELCALYRYAGRKNISTMLGENLFHILSLAAVDPEPGALTKHLQRGDL